MVSVRSWQDAIAAGHGKCPLSAHDIRLAEKAGLTAFSARAREMAATGQGVIPHDGNNARMILTSMLELLAMGEWRSYADMLEMYGDKAVADPVHYSAVSYGLQAIDGFLRTKGHAL